MKNLPVETRARIPEIRAHYDTPVLVNTDPPDHTRLRRAVSANFTPRSLGALRPTIDEVVERLLDDMKPEAEVDLLASFAYPLPALVIARLLGVPEKDRPRLVTWSADITAFTGSYFRPMLAGRAENSMRQFREYLRSLIAIRRKSPGEDILSDLLGDTGSEGSLTDDELVGTAVTLLFAGHETTANLIANGMVALFRHPDQLRWLADHPDFAPTAIEELLRYDSPVHRTRRIATASVSLRGHTIRAGDPVSNLLGAANRDAEHYAEPDALTFERRGAGHLSFGHGIHYCVGAALSRLEAPIAMSALLARYPGISLTHRSRVRWKRNLAFRGVEKLPVRLA